MAEQLTLNQRVQGSSPCAPTNKIKDLEEADTVHSDKIGPSIPTNWLLLFFRSGVSWRPKLLASTLAYQVQNSEKAPFDAVVC